MKTVRRSVAALGAVVVGTMALGACNNTDGATKVQARTPSTATRDCTDPSMPVGEWQQRCAGGSRTTPPAPGTPDAGATTSAGATASGTTSAGSGPGLTATSPSAAPTAAPSAAPGGVKTVGVGDAVSLSGYKGDKFDVTLVKIVDPAGSSNSFTTPKPGFRFVAVQWRVANTGSVVVDTGPTSASKLIDGQGQQLDSTYAEISAGVAYPSGAQITPGQSRLGFVVYEVPADSKIVTVQFATYGVGFTNDIAEWKLA